MKLMLNEPMSLHTTIGVGGRAKIFAYPESTGELKSLMDERYLIIGRGSDTIFDDDGFDGVVISLERCFKDINFEAIGEDRMIIRVGSGVTLPRLIKETEKEGLIGLEFLWGIPGTSGGACYMNAGAFGSCFLKFVKELKVITLKEKLNRSFKADEITFSDRVGVRGFVIKEAVMELGKGDPKERLSEFKKWRREHQPLGQKTAGCIFKNPSGDYAGRLIEAAGLKGKRIGDAVISQRHANFIVNLGHAKSKDVLSLIEVVRDRVFQKFDTRLELEVEIVGREGKMRDADSQLGGSS